MDLASNKQTAMLIQTLPVQYMKTKLTTRSRGSLKGESHGIILDSLKDFRHSF